MYVCTLGFMVHPMDYINFGEVNYVVNINN